jgi:glycerophosphoryl diester phosphodiesterase
VFGDLPYTPAQTDNYELLIDAINDDREVDVVINLGDTKSGGTSCDDEYLSFIRESFLDFNDPLYYTPGDNEWTDCHRDSNGDFNPNERLDKIRELYFDRPGQSLSSDRRARKLHQGRDGYPENTTWYQSGVQIGLVHVVGSNNGLREWELGPDDEDLPEERIAEVEARTEAALAWIDKIFDDAEKRRAAGVMVVVHADMWGVFEFSGGIDMSGFTPIVEKLAARTEAFGKPVLLVNGDSHDYYTWKPLSDSDTHPNAEFYAGEGRTDLAGVDSAFYHGVGGDIDNLTQVVVEIWDRFDPEPEFLADEDFGWLSVTIDPRSDEVFSFEQRYVDTSAIVSENSGATLAGWAALPADTFAEGPPSGNYINEANGRIPPFDGQPVQGFSAILDNGDGTFDAMSDNGFGSITNSPDYHLRVYTIRPDFRTGGENGLATDGGAGGIEVEGFIELSDPDGHIPFAIVNHWTDDRILTGADFDIESFQKTKDGTIWFGDEHGPFLLHTDATGKLLEAPIPLPNPDGGELRAPENPFNEEISTLRTMNALRAHALANGNTKTPVVSPWYVMLVDGDDTVNHPGRVASADDPNVSADGLSAPASSEIHDIVQLHRAGYQVVPYTINDADEMARLIELDVDGIISDRPDLLYQVVADHDADGDGQAGDWLLADGRIDQAAFDAQGHRGARNLRPENTIPAMESALDWLMNTLEFDTGITADGVAVLNHDPVIEPGKCRLANGDPYTEDNEKLVLEVTAAELQNDFICDKLFRGPDQTNDLALSPVSVAFAAEQGIDPYVMPTLDQVFDFVVFYQAWYTDGPGAGDEGAAALAANAAEVRYNIETKINPTPEGAVRTVSPQGFIDGVMASVNDAGVSEQTFIQSFDWRTLLLMHEQYPSVQTVALYGDFPGGPGEGGTNLQDLDGENTPWLAGLYWPWRVTETTSPRLVPGSGGFEGMALAPNGRLITMLEKPIRDTTGRQLLMSEFNPRTSRYTGKTWFYPLDVRGAAIGDFIMFNPRKGLVIERDNSQGDLDGFKAIYEIRLRGRGTVAEKALVVDLMNIADPNGVAPEAGPGDLGIGGETFAFPFVTIEDVVVIDDDTIGVLNDNNYPFSVGRHLGDPAAGVDPQPDDNEFIILDLKKKLGSHTR